MAEKTGRGIDRIFEGSIIYGRPLPDYSETTTTCVKLFIQRAEPDLTFTKNENVVDLLNATSSQEYRLLKNL